MVWGLLVRHPEEFSSLKERHEKAREITGREPASPVQITGYVKGPIMKANSKLNVAPESRCIE